MSTPFCVTPGSYYGISREKRPNGLGSTQILATLRRFAQDLGTKLAVIDACTGDLIIRITPEQWPTLSRLLDEAFDLPPAAREQWLAQLAPVHLPLQPVLSDLLAKHAVAETDDFLKTLPKFTVAARLKSTRDMSCGKARAGHRCLPAKSGHSTCYLLAAPVHAP